MAQSNKIAEFLPSSFGTILFTELTLKSKDTYYLFRRHICEYQERTGIDLMQPIVPRTTKRCKAI